ncbi:MAG: tyrosinase family protein [Gammaproteobacteria bacterium]|nr:tyrosinase family protein [Gammaproteobacteria bacterium]
MRRFAGWLGLPALSVAAFLATTQWFASTPCIWPIGDDSQPPLSATWLEEMASAHGTGEQVPERKPLDALSEEEWEDFGEALAIFRSAESGSESEIPATGYFALAAHHGTDSVVKTQIGMPDLSADRKWCECIHGVKGVAAGPEDGPAPLFLLWHRAYIHAFELSIRSIMRYELTDLRRLENRRLPDWQHFRLPYWDWAAPEDTSVRRTDRNLRRQNELAQIKARFIPINTSEPLQSMAVPSLGTTDPQRLSGNPFFAKNRNERFCQGDCTSDIIDFKRIANPLVAASKLPFADFERRLSDSWHQVIHNSVGSFAAGMAAPASAAQDPLFWVHHANVDRLWMAWVREYAGTTPAVPHLEGAWRAATVRFPVRVRDQLRVYAPTYESLAVNSATGALGYRYTTLDHVSEGPTEQYKLGKDVEQIPMDACSREILSGACRQPNARSILIGTKSQIVVSGRGMIVTLQPSQDQLPDLEAKLTSADPSGDFESVYVGVRLSIDDNKKTRKEIAGNNDLVAVQIYAIPRLEADPSNADQPIELLPKYYLGSVDLFSPNEANGWQYFGFSYAAAGDTLSRFLERHRGDRWRIDLVILPLFSDPTDPVVQAQSIVQFAKIGVAARLRSGSPG